MSDFKFACPTCGQHIAGDERWAGAQIKCPSCQADMIVPPLETAPAPPPPVRLSVAPASAAPAQSAPAAPAPPAPPSPPASPVRLSLTPAPKAHAAPTPPAAPAAPASPPPPVSGPPRSAAGPAPKPYVPSYLKPEEKQSKARAILTVAIVVVVLGVAVAIVAPMINSAQDKMNEQRKKDSEDSGGGQVGHLMELNNMLDATDPARFERGAGEKQKRLTERKHSLDVATASIPSETVCGKITNLAFMLDDASLEINAGMHLLSLRQGEGIIPDREFLISLRLNPGENIQGKSWTISKETTAGAPGIAKKWRTDYNSNPKQVSYTSGYALKLEFGKAASGIISGKIYLALPDPEQSVIAGEFHADIRVPGAAGTRQGRQRLPAFGDD